MVRIEFANVPVHLHAEIQKSQSHIFSLEQLAVVPHCCQPPLAGILPQICRRGAGLFAKL